VPITVQPLDIIDLDALESGETACPHCGQAHRSVKATPQYLSAVVGDFLEQDEKARFNRVLGEYFRQVEVIAFLPMKFCGPEWRKEQTRWRELFLTAKLKRDEISHTAEQVKEVRLQDHLAALRAIRNENPHLYRLRDAREAEYRATLELTCLNPSTNTGSV
jgi:hypothetical protein